MEKEDLDELQGLVIGFLQEGIKEHPYGFSLSEFEVQYPKKTDEPQNWYSRYKKRTALEALQCISRDVIKIYDRGATKYIALNQASDKVDQDLIELIKGQRSSTKKRGSGFRRPSHVQANLFHRMNRSYSNTTDRNNRSTRLNYDRHMDNSFIRRDEPSQMFKPMPVSSSKRTPGDPRSFVPPQVKPSTLESKYTSRPLTSSLRPTLVSEPKPVKVVEDPKILQKLDQIRQRIEFLLKKKSEIKLLYLKGHYELEFQETIDPTSLGFRSITELIQCPTIQASIKLINKPPHWVMCLKNLKENIPIPVAARVAKLDAIDPFNVRTMLQCLEPLGDLKQEPKTQSAY